MSASTRTTPGSRMLVVSDDRASAAALADVLTEHGHRVCIARSEGEARRAIEREGADVAFIELRPDRDGGQATMRTLMELQPDLPCIVTAPQGEPALACAALEHGAWDCVLTPAPRAILFATVERALAKVRLERDLRQVLKLQLLGSLAGRVAHDFNNVLTVILGNLALARSAVPADVFDVQDSLEGIELACRRATSLTGQLLAFCRGGPLRPEVLDPRTILAELTRMLGRLVRADIHLEITCASDVAGVRIDPGQLDQALLNLVVNACDAMPHGGKLAINARNTRSDEGPAGIDVGVVFTVADNGIGMAPEMLGRIFDPFFTTKGDDRGTGLGLASAKQMTEQAGGAITVESKLGHGSTFRIWLPAVAPPTVLVPRLAAPADREVGAETILVCESHDGLRRMLCRTLDRHGYRTLEATDGGQALAAAHAHGAPIDLLIAEPTLPGVGGLQLARAVAGVHAGIQVLFLSGGSDVDATLTAVGAPILAKPFGPAQLLRAVRGALDGAQPPARRH